MATIAFHCPHWMLRFRRRERHEIRARIAGGGEVVVVVVVVVVDAVASLLRQKRVDWPTMTVGWALLEPSRA